MRRLSKSDFCSFTEIARMTVFARSAVAENLLTITKALNDQWLIDKNVQLVEESLFTERQWKINYLSEYKNDLPHRMEDLLHRLNTQ